MVGQNIGKYRVLDRVGRGGMGTVYRAIDETLHREVAIKVLNAELNDPEVARRFRGEAITVARLSHPGIATIYELFQHDGQWLMVMEFLRGETLEHVVSRGGALQPDRAAQLCMQSLAALAHAHSMAVVHRDLKPANIMLTDSGDIKIMDFGIARVTGTEHLTNVGFMMGTPAYMAPEQVLGQETDARADLYAVGVVLFRLVTGELPFKGESPFAMAQAQVNATPTPVSSLRIGLPPWVEEVLTRALAKKPDDRYQSASEFHDTLERALTGAPTPATYRSSAPAGLVATPSRAMPTGSIEAIGPIGNSGRMEATSPLQFDPSGMAPTIASPTPAMLERPRTAVMSTATATASPTPTTRANEVSVPPAAPLPAPSAPPASSGRSIGLIGAAVAAVLVLGGGAWWMMSPRAPEPVAATEPAPPPVEVPPPTPVPEPVAPTPAPAPSPSTPARGASTAATATAGIDPATGAARDGRAGAAGTGRRGATPAPAVVPEIEAPVDTAPPASITNIKVMVVNGRNADDQDATLNFAAGEIAAVAARGGSVLATLPYSRVNSATYVHARSPRWDTALASPPEGLDVGGVFRASRHWLVLQNPDSYVILRLEDVNVIRVLREVEQRTGISIRRPTNNN